MIISTTEMHIKEQFFFSTVEKYMKIMVELKTRDLDGILYLSVNHRNTGQFQVSRYLEVSDHKYSNVQCLNTHTDNVPYLLCLKLVRRDDICHWYHFVPIDWIQILRHVLIEQRKE